MRRFFNSVLVNIIGLTVLAVAAYAQSPITCGALTYTQTTMSTSTVEVPYVVKNHTFQPIMVRCAPLTGAFYWDVDTLTLDAYAVDTITVLARGTFGHGGINMCRPDISYSSPTGHVPPGECGSQFFVKFLDRTDGPALRFRDAVLHFGPNIDPDTTREDGIPEVRRDTKFDGAGTVGMNISSIYLTGRDASAFKVPTADKYRSIGPTDNFPFGVTAQPNGSGQSMEAMVHIVGITNDGDTARASMKLVIGEVIENPDVRVSTSKIVFGTNKAGLEPVERSFSIFNKGNTNAIVLTYELTGRDAGQFSTNLVAMVPHTIVPNTASDIAVTCTPNGIGALEATLKLITVSGSVQFEHYIDLHCLIDSMITTPIRLRLETEDVIQGSTTTVRLKALDDVTENIYGCVVKLRYDESVLRLETQPREPVTSDGSFSIATFEAVTGPIEANRDLTAIDFHVIGDPGSSSPVDVVSVAWFDAEGKTVDRETLVNGTTLNVQDDANAHFTVAPLPLTDVTTVSYPEMTSSGTLEMININGAVVNRSNIVAGTTTATINTSFLPSGVYTVILRTPNGILRKLVVR